MFMHYKKGKSFFFQLARLLMVNHDNLCLCEAAINRLDAHCLSLKKLKNPPTKPTKN